MKAKIKIIEQTWTGWVREQPEPKENMMEVGVGDSLIFNPEELGNPSMVVKEISADSVTIVSSKLAPRQESGGINLSKDYSELETILKIGETKELGTQTMDFGEHYKLTLTEVV